MSIAIAPGVFDIVPENFKEQWKSSYIWQYVEEQIRAITRSYGFSELRTPLFERTELFQRSVGQATDIVSKEMYSFTDKGQRNLSLRPEGTAAAMRAFVDHYSHGSIRQQKLYYIAPMFRYERSQAGRYRQHHQFGVEAIGSAGAEQDVELIDMLHTLYNRLGLKNLIVNVNSIGDVASRSAFKEKLIDYLEKYYQSLSPDSQRRFELNPMRILDSKAAEDQAIIAHAPSIVDSLNSNSRDHFERLKKLLSVLKIPFQVNTQLVRGLDYYNHTVFEITAGELGSQNSLVGGGRYDGLLKALGGPDLPASGFGCGIERLLQTMLKQGVALPQLPKPTLYIIPLGERAKDDCFSLAHQLRHIGHDIEMDYGSRKLSKAMQVANRLGAKYVAVIGDSELDSGIVDLKEMETGTTKTIAFDEIANAISQ